MTTPTPLIGFTAEQLGKLQKLRGAIEVSDTSAVLDELFEVYLLVLEELPNDRAETVTPSVRLQEAMLLYRHASDAARNGKGLATIEVGEAEGGKQFKLCPIPVSASLAPVYEEALRQKEIAAKRQASIRLAAANTSAPPA